MSDANIELATLASAPKLHRHGRSGGGSGRSTQPRASAPRRPRPRPAPPPRARAPRARSDCAPAIDFDPVFGEAKRDEQRGHDTPQLHDVAGLERRPRVQDFGHLAAGRKRGAVRRGGGRHGGRSATRPGRTVSSARLLFSAALSSTAHFSLWLRAERAAPSSSPACARVSHRTPRARPSRPWDAPTTALQSPMSFCRGASRMLVPVPELRSTSLLALDDRNRSPIAVGATTARRASASGGRAHKVVEADASSACVGRFPWCSDQLNFQTSSLQLWRRRCCTRGSRTSRAERCGCCVWRNGNSVGYSAA